MTRVLNETYDAETETRPSDRDVGVMMLRRDRDGQKMPRDRDVLGRYYNPANDPKELLLYTSNCVLCLRDCNVRGAIKKFSALPSSVQNKIKIVLASHSSKA